LESQGHGALPRLLIFWYLAVFFCCAVFWLHPASEPDAKTHAITMYEIIFLKTTDFNANIK